MSNFRLVLRQIVKQPGFSFTVIVMLALGIGAMTAMFSLFHTVLLRPLPVHEPVRLVNLMSPGPRIGGWSTGIAGGLDSVFSYPMFRDLEERQDVLTGLAAHRTFDANVSAGLQPESTQGLLVSGQYFDVLGVQPALGRLIGRQDEPAVGESPVAVLSHAFWKSRLGEDPGAIGRSITVNAQSLTVIGVAPEGFSGTTIGVEPSIFVPLTLAWRMQPGMSNDDSERGWHWLHLFGRLRDGVPIEQAEASLNALHSGILNEVEAPMYSLPGDVLERFRNRPLLLESGARGQSSRRGDMQRPLTLLLGLTAVVLAVVFVNIASLLLARTASREPEIAIRISVGATRARLLGQYLSETATLAVLGGMASLPVAALVMARIVALLPSERSGITSIGIDASTALLVAAATIASLLVLGVVPALRSSKTSGTDLAQGSATRVSGTKSSTSVWRSLATAQVSLATVLLVLAGLFTQSLVNVTHVNLGMDIDSVATFSISPGLSGYDSARISETYREIEERISAEPGVIDASSALVPLLSFSNFHRPIEVEGFDGGPATDSDASFNIVSPAFFETLSIPLLAGRNFARTDQVGSRQVAVVNQSFVRKLGLGNALGKRFSFPDAPDASYEIIGVVADAKYNQVKDEIPPQFYLPLREDASFGSLSFYVRSGIPPVSILGSIRSAVGRVDPTLALGDLQPLSATFRSNVFLDRTIALLSVGFASLATLLATIGLYGVLAYSMSQRTRELGLRLALGSTRGRLRRLVLSQVGKMTLVGSIVGLAAATALGTLVQSMLYGLSAISPLVIVGTVAVLGLVSFAASYLPAHRAMRVDPMRALRE